MKPTVSITRLENGTTEYHYRRPDPYEPRYSFSQTVVIPSPPAATTMRSPAVEKS